MTVVWCTGVWKGVAAQSPCLNHSSRRALFLDRDGVINADVGYAHRPEQIQWVEGIFDLCRRARKHAWDLVVVTNQSGVGRGMFGRDAVESLCVWMGQRLHAECGQAPVFFACPDLPTQGITPSPMDYRKPGAGMLLHAASQYGYTMAQCAMVGDKTSDILAAQAAGLCHIWHFHAHASLQNTTQGPSDTAQVIRALAQVNLPP